MGSFVRFMVKYLFLVLAALGVVDLCFVLQASKSCKAFVLETADFFVTAMVYVGASLVFGALQLLRQLLALLCWAVMSGNAYKALVVTPRFFFLLAVVLVLLCAAIRATEAAIIHALDVLFPSLMQQGTSDDALDRIKLSQQEGSSDTLSYERQRNGELEARITALEQGMAAQMSLQTSQAVAAFKAHTRGKLRLQQESSTALVAGLKAKLAHQLAAAHLLKQQKDQVTATLDAQCATLKAQNAALVAQLDISRQQVMHTQAAMQFQASAAQQSSQLLHNAFVVKSAEADEDAKRAHAQFAIMLAHIQQLECEQAGLTSCIEAMGSKLTSDRRCSLLAAALTAVSRSPASASNQRSLQESAHEAKHLLPCQPRTPTHSQDMSAASGSSFSNFAS